MASDPNIGTSAPVQPFLRPGIAMPVPAMAAPIFHAPLPSLPVSAPNVTMTPTPAMQQQGELNRLQSTGSGIDQIHSPLLRGIARAADITGAIAGSVFAPLRVAETLTPGTNEHHQYLVRQQQDRVADANANELAGAQVQDAEAQAQQRKTLATQEEAKAEMLRDPKKAIDPSKTIQTDDGVYQMNPDTGHYDVRVGDRVEKQKSPEQAAYDDAIAHGQSPLAAFQAVKQAANVKDSSLQQQFLDGYVRAHPEVPIQDAIAATIRATSTQPRIEVHAAEARPEPTGTWQMAQGGDGKPVLFNSKTGEVRDNPAGITKGGGKAAKPNVDEQKRADFAQNMGENINNIEDVLKRRPELFGPIAGRVTGWRSMLGTDDPDIAKLEAAEHQLSMVTQGVHGMRSSQGLEGAARSLLNGFKNSPAATRAALETARASTRTFIQDADNPGQSRAASPAVVLESTPASHQFSISAWQRANPKGDATAARAAARSQGYTVVN